MQNLDLSGKTAVVCGASEGLGREIATHLAQLRLQHLVLIARTKSQLEELAKKLAQSVGQTGLQVHIYPTDLCQPVDVQATSQTIQKNLGRVHFLVQAVGQSDRGKLSQLSIERNQHLFDLNVQSSLNVIHSFEDLLSAHPKESASSLVLIGSLASLFAPRYLGGYAIAKHALAGLAQQARLELAEKGISVTLACPGPIARDDAGRRYEARDSELPKSALQPGGGAKTKGLDACMLAQDIVQSACKRKSRIIRPRSAAILHLLYAFSPSLGDFILRKKTS